MAVMGADKGTYAHARKPAVEKERKFHSARASAKNEPLDSISNGKNALAPAKDYPKKGQ